MVQRARIAVVDDDPRVLESLKNLLESEGYDVMIFPCAEDFLKVHSDIHVDCLISDLRMPGLGGFSLLQMMQSECQALPVIVITAQERRFDESLFVKAGARFVFHKPFDGGDLLEAVAASLTTADPDS